MIINSNKLSIPIQISGSEVKNIETLGLIDSGAGGKFIDQNYARAAGFKLCKPETPLQAYNMDGTENKRGTVKTYINLDLEITVLYTKSELSPSLVLGLLGLRSDSTRNTWGSVKTSLK